MLTLLLGIIYLSFISLGLPDSLLGSAWPSMYGALQVPVSYAGIVSMIISGGTILSSLFSGKTIKMLGTGKVTAISVGMTAAALWGFSASHTFVSLCLWAVPYGLGAGAVDAALNNFIALHYKAKHMNWLHCCWGIGATLGPYIMGFCLTMGKQWNAGYRSISALQIGLTVILLLSLPLWKIKNSSENTKEEAGAALKMGELLRIKGVLPALAAFFCYCALETTTGLWASSFLVMERGISAQSAAKWASFFYLGITFGRFLSGFLSMKISGRNMVRLGQLLAGIGVVSLFFSLGNTVLCAGFVLIGLGCAPIYPSLLHETPENFGRNVSQSIMGLQMASAYIGSTFMPPLFGIIAEHSSISYFPVYLFLFAALMFVTTEFLLRVIHKSRAEVPLKNATE